MIRKIGMAACAAGLALGAVAVVAGPASAAKPTITATGSASCSGLAGKVKINPPLSNTNTVPSHLTGKLKAASCTGTTEQGVTPSSAKLIVDSLGTNPGTCAGLTQAGTTPFTVSVNWKASGGKINPSTIVFPSASLEGSGYGLHNGNVGGSYANTGGANAQANVDLGVVATDLGTKCDPTTKNGKTKAPKGIKKIAIISGTLSTG